MLHQIAFPKVVWSSEKHWGDLAHKTGDQSRVRKIIQRAPAEKQATIYWTPAMISVTSQILYPSSLRIRNLIRNFFYFYKTIHPKTYFCKHLLYDSLWVNHLNGRMKKITCPQDVHRKRDEIKERHLRKPWEGWNTGKKCHIMQYVSQ